MLSSIAALGMDCVCRRDNEHCDREYDIRVAVRPI